MTKYNGLKGQATPSTSRRLRRLHPELDAPILPPLRRDQREWVFEVREVKSENKKLSLFFEKCKMKKNAFTLFREVQSEKNAFTPFREVKSEIKILRDREVKILENS